MEKTLYSYSFERWKIWLRDAIQCSNVAKTELNISKENLTKVVRGGTLVRSEFMELVDKELKNVWNESKEKSGEKVSWNIWKSLDKLNVQQGTFKGILVGDLELESLEKDITDNKKNEIGNKAVVYAGIKVDKNEEEILCLPPDHSIFPKVDIEEFDTDMEKCGIKAKWNALKEERKTEEKKAMEEASEQIKNDEEEDMFKFYDIETKSLD